MKKQTKQENLIPRYKVWLVDSDESSRQFICYYLRILSFDVRSFEKSEDILYRLFMQGSLPEEMPDLIIVDLTFRKDKSLITKLCESNVTAEILAVSGSLAMLDEAVILGASASLPKPFPDPLVLAGEATRLAAIGRQRHEQWIKGGIEACENDLAKTRKEVFLSFSNEEREFANGIRRKLESQNISVWFAPVTLEYGDEWLVRLIKGIDQARVFIAVISDSYLKSGSCLGEYARFSIRTENTREPKPMLLPILLRRPRTKMAIRMLKPIFDKYQYVDLATHYREKLPVLLGRIRTVIDQRRPSLAA